MKYLLDRENLEMLNKAVEIYVQLHKGKNRE